MIPEESWAECWQATRRNLLAQAAILTLSCAVCFISSFFFSPRLLFIDLLFKLPLFFVHIGIGRILTEWVYWAGAELFMTILSFLSSALHVSAALFSILSCSLLSLTWSFYLSLLLPLSLSLADDVLI